MSEAKAPLTKLEMREFVDGFNDTVKNYKPPDYDKVSRRDVHLTNINHRRLSSLLDRIEATYPPAQV